MKHCSIENCPNKYYAKGYCSMHLQRLRKYGDPLITKLSRHGGDGTPEYRAWVEMRRRCRDKSRNNYKDYGGRGIAVCERWLLFPNFLEDMGLKPSPKHSVERKDVNGNYEPSNCIWATQTEQANNRRNNNLLTFDETTKSLAQWSKTLSIPETTIRNRISRGWTIDRVLWSGDGRHKIRVNV